MGVLEQTSAHRGRPTTRATHRAAATSERVVAAGPYASGPVFDRLSARSCHRRRGDGSRAVGQARHRIVDRLGRTGMAVADPGRRSSTSFSASTASSAAPAAARRPAATMITGPPRRRPAATTIWRPLNAPRSTSPDARRSPATPSGCCTMATRPIRNARRHQAADQRSVVQLHHPCDAAGGRFIEALIAAHRRGAAVRVLIDGIGGGYFFSPVYQQAASRQRAGRALPAFAAALADAVPQPAHAQEDPGRSMAASGSAAA